jgi:hypothetical protein
MWRICILALSLGAVPLFAATEIHVFEAVLSATNENPPVTNAAAVGDARIGMRLERSAGGTITDAVVDFDLKVYLGQTEELIALHIHRGVAGVNGPVVISSGGLDFNTDPIPDVSGDVRIYRQRVAGNDPAVIEAINGILANPAGYYVNLHSTSNRPGITRGQLYRTDGSLISMVGDQLADNEDSISALADMLAKLRTNLNNVARRLGLVPVN